MKYIIPEPTSTLGEVVVYVEKKSAWPVLLAVLAVIIWDQRRK